MCRGPFDQVALFTGWPAAAMEAGLLTGVAAVCLGRRPGTKPRIQRQSEYKSGTVTQTGLILPGSMARALLCACTWGNLPSALTGTYTTSCANVSAAVTISGR